MLQWGLLKCLKSKEEKNVIWYSECHLQCWHAAQNSQELNNDSEPRSEKALCFSKDSKQIHIYHLTWLSNLPWSGKGYYHCLSFVGRESRAQSSGETQGLYIYHIYTVLLFTFLKWVYCAFPGNISFHSHKSLWSSQENTTLTCYFEVHSLP